jgi:four helix bundle protein
MGKEDNKAENIMSMNYTTDRGGTSGDLPERLFQFALRIIKVVRALPKETAALEIGRQLMRSGTSIAANYEEAKGAFSKQDFTYKLSICFKEARETNLWLRLLLASGMVKGTKLKALVKESEEIRNILGKSVTTARRNEK